MDKLLKHRINAGRVAVKEQVPFFRRQFGQVPSEWKADETRVTFADFAISENILTELRRSFPDDDFLSEEGNPADEVLPLRARFAWLLDPIDGTNNYALGMPACAISLALLRDGEPLYGFVYDLGRDVLVEGGPGFGLLDNGRPVPARPRAFGGQSVLGLGFPLPEAVARALLPLFATQRIRSIGSGALNLTYTALGLIDACIDFRCKSWDIAACHAFIKAVDCPIHYINGPVFPLTEFHVTQSPSPYYAGNKEFCDAIESMLKAEG